MNHLFLLKTSLARRDIDERSTRITTIGLGIAKDCLSGACQIRNSGERPNGWDLTEFPRRLEDALGP